MALVSKQPIGVSINADSDDFNYYASGVLTDTTYGFSSNGTANAMTDTDHAVTLVGYSVNNQTKGCNGYWIVKNSWSTDWGEYGFFRVCMTNDKTFPMGVYNILSCVALPDVGLLGANKTSLIMSGV